MTTACGIDERLSTISALVIPLRFRPDTLELVRRHAARSGAGIPQSEFDHRAARSCFKASEKRPRTTSAPLMIGRVQGNVPVRHVHSVGVTVSILVLDIVRSGCGTHLFEVFMHVLFSHNYLLRCYSDNTSDFVSARAIKVA